MSAKFERIGVQAVTRAATAAVLGLALNLTGASGPAVRADEQRDPRDPDARLQVIIKSIKILDDNDWGEGEFKFSLEFWRNTRDCIPQAEEDCETILARSAPIQFKGDDGETKVINALLPDGSPGAYAANPTIAADTGIPVWATETYGMLLRGWEVDTVVDDQVGTLVWDINAANGWDLGTRTERGMQGWSKIIGGFGFEAADTIVEYEIRRMPLPDLVATALLPTGKVGNDDRLCAAVQNAGPDPSPEFFTVFRVDGGVLPSGSTGSPTLQPGESRDVCITTQLPTSENYTLTATVDEARLVYETNELNNFASRSHTLKTIDIADKPLIPIRPLDSADSGTDSGPAANTQADLIVDQIRVKGGPNDCDPGKNDVTVSVKNMGNKAAAAFALRLVVNGDDATVERPLASLDAGKSQEITFDGVRLGDKQTDLVVTVDAASTVPESNEGNNKKSLTVRCKDD